VPCPESARAAPRNREAEDPPSELLGGQGAARPLQALAAWPRCETEPAARCDQAPRLPGQPGGRPRLSKHRRLDERAALARAALSFWLGQLASLARLRSNRF
jgi:hypothetical protein